MAVPMDDVEPLEKREMGWLRISIGHRRQDKERIPAPAREDGSKEKRRETHLPDVKVM